MKKVSKTDDEWKTLLPSDAYRVLRQCGTEAPFTGKLLHNKQSGIYVCGACGNPVFSSNAKYDSKSGWPSFWEPASKEALEYKEDFSLAGKRVEVRCAKCGGHLGHVFDDGPAPTGKRFCINSLALGFKEKSQK